MHALRRTRPSPAPPQARRRRRGGERDPASLVVGRKRAREKPAWLSGPAAVWRSTESSFVLTPPSARLTTYERKPELNKCEAINSDPLTPVAVGRTLLGRIGETAALSLRPGFV
jgi:hypothetical protein